MLGFGEACTPTQVRQVWELEQVAQSPEQAVQVEVVLEEAVPQYPALHEQKLEDGEELGSLQEVQEVELLQDRQRALQAPQDVGEVRGETPS